MPETPEAHLARAAERFGRLGRKGKPRGGGGKRVVGYGWLVLFVCFLTIFLWVFVFLFEETTRCSCNFLA